MTDGYLHVPRGAWRRGLTADGRSTALLDCPGCGKEFSLTNHAIDYDGRVSPSVACPYGCGFHEYLMLVGWKTH